MDPESGAEPGRGVTPLLWGKGTCLVDVNGEHLSTKKETKVLDGNQAEPEGFSKGDPCKENLALQPKVEVYYKLFLWQPFGGKRKGRRETS